MYIYIYYMEHEQPDVLLKYWPWHKFSWIVFISLIKLSLKIMMRILFTFLGANFYDIICSLLEVSQTIFSCHLNYVFTTSNIKTTADNVGTTDRWSESEGIPLVICLLLNFIHTNRVQLAPLMQYVLGLWQPSDIVSTVSGRGIGKLKSVSCWVRYEMHFCHNIPCNM